MKKTVGFIYFDELQHIHHFLSPAIELAKEEDIEVHILTYVGNHEYLYKLIDLMGGTKVKVLPLETYFYRRIIEKISQRQQPSALYIYQKQINKFLGYDALIFTDHTAGVIHKAKTEAKKPLLILLGHGAGDGAYGYKETHNLFDVLIVAGSKKYKRLEKAFPNHKFILAVGGFNKLDVVKAEYKEHKTFNNPNPIILYCPHFKEEISSWHSHGLSILDYFVNHPAYNLIFAPHYNLFNKKASKFSLASIEKFYNRPNIYIDLGSVKSTNMSYVLDSDIYLGDVSSQVYEFMVKTRPIIFFNAHHINWQDDENYLMWRAGKVVDTIDELDEALLTINEWPGLYEDKQRELFEETFDKPDKPAGIRTARIIKEEIG